MEVKDEVQVIEWRSTLRRVSSLKLQRMLTVRFNQNPSELKNSLTNPIKDICAAQLWHFVFQHCRDAWREAAMSHRGTIPNLNGWWSKWNDETSSCYECLVTEVLFEVKQLWGKVHEASAFVVTFRRHSVSFAGFNKRLLTRATVVVWHTRRHMR